jgi:eukaryotic-like serine/threonine-protein kinase
MSYETRVNPHSRSASAAPVAFLTSLFTSLAVTVGVLALTGNLKMPGSGDAAKTAVPAVRKVPSVIGIAPEVAGDVVRARELRLLVRGEREDSKMAKGKIVEQDPMAGSDLEAGGAVKVTVSLGPKTIEVPPVIGKPTEEAKQLITEKGLAVGKVDPSGEGPPGTVIDAEPKPGTELSEGQEVSLVVSPDGIVVPEVVGMYVGKARKELEAVGLKKGSTTWRYNEYRDENVVLSQEPAAGAIAPPGSEVNLVVNEED